MIRKSILYFIAGTISGVVAMVALFLFYVIKVDLEDLPIWRLF